jgi:phosphomevalonate kinase
MSGVSVRAPGKALLCGEYAVLHGAPAVAVAVDRCAVANVGHGQASPFLAAARAHAARALGGEVPEICVDTRELYNAEAKLGLGSSAAVTVAAVGLAWHAAGRSLADRQALFAVADAAHGEAQGTRGSGVDVACAVWGGTVRFCRRSGGVDVRPVDLPDGVQLTFVYTGRSASTAEMIGRVKALAEAEPALHDAQIGRLRSLAHAFDSAVTANDAAALIRVADDYGAAMAALGEAAGSPIVTPELAALAALARRHGGAAKPSGAGGGDLGVAFTVGTEATRALHDDLGATNLMLLAMGAPAPGLRLEIA